MFFSVHFFCVFMAQTTSELFTACFENDDIAPVIEFIRNGGDINQTVECTGDTLMHNACYFNHPEILEELLSHPDVDVNKQNRFKETPLSIAWGFEWIEIIKILVMDSRVEVSTFCRSTGKGRTSRIEFYKFHDSENMQRCFRLILACDRFNDDPSKVNGNMCGSSFFLFKQFENDPIKTRRQLRIETGLAAYDAAKLFIMVVGLCDGYYILNQRDQQQFFKIAICLPMDLQMVLCNRCFGLKADVISGLERALRLMIREKHL